MSISTSLSVKAMMTISKEVLSLSLCYCYNTVEPELWVTSYLVTKLHNMLHVEVSQQVVFIQTCNNITLQRFDISCVTYFLYKRLFTNSHFSKLLLKILLAILSSIMQTYLIWNQLLFITFFVAWGSSHRWAWIFFCIYVIMNEDCDSLL